MVGAGEDLLPIECDRPSLCGPIDIDDEASGNPGFPFSDRFVVGSSSGVDSTVGLEANSPSAWTVEEYYELEPVFDDHHGQFEVIVGKLEREATVAEAVTDAERELVVSESPSPEAEGLSVHHSHRRYDGGGAKIDLCGDVARSRAAAHHWRLSDGVRGRSEVYVVEEDGSRGLVFLGRLEQWVVSAVIILAWVVEQWAVVDMILVSILVGIFDLELSEGRCGYPEQSDEYSEKPLTLKAHDTLHNPSLP
jgi:hypothetical protein